MLEDWVAQMAGRLYEKKFLELVGSVIKSNRTENLDSVFCSELVKKYSLNTITMPLHYSLASSVTFIYCLQVDANYVSVGCMRLCEDGPVLSKHSGKQLLAQRFCKLHLPTEGIPLP